MTVLQGGAVDVLPFCLAAQQIQPYSRLPKLDQADSGITSLNINPTQVTDHQPHPVLRSVDLWIKGSVKSRAF